MVRLPACTADMSVTWKFFEICETDVTHASCNACKRLVPRGGNKPNRFNTTNLIWHLKSFHSKEHNDFLRLTSEKKKTTPSQQALLLTTVESSQPYNPRGEKAMRITRRMMEFICLDHQPVSAVEGFGFQRLSYFFQLFSWLFQTLFKPQAIYLKCVCLHDPQGQREMWEWAIIICYTVVQCAIMPLYCQCWVWHFEFV